MQKVLPYFSSINDIDTIEVFSLYKSNPLIFTNGNFISPVSYSLYFGRHYDQQIIKYTVIEITGNKRIY